MIPKRISNAVINSLKGGVVPRVGLQYVTVGREAEINALLHDIEVIEDGGASFRFIVGKYGSGKSFLLQTIRNYAMDRGFAVVDADLSPDRRLQGTRGQGLATYKELIKNMAVKARPDGGALPNILEKWIDTVQSEAAAENPGCSLEVIENACEKRIYEITGSMGELVHGFDFARLLSMYYRAYMADDGETKANVIKWFRGEYTTRTDAKAELGVRNIIGDDDWYEYIKIFAVFLKKAGYGGLLVLIDELVNIYKIPQSITRQYNYEKILTMYNDTMQGKASGFGIIMCGTPQCIEDTRRGIFSYEALRSRLSAGRFSSENTKDLLAPIINLHPLTNEELLVLTDKLTCIHGELFGYTPAVTQNEMIDFLKIEFSRVGAQTMITPREIIRDYIELLDILYQNPEKKPDDIIRSADFEFSDFSSGDGDAEKQDSDEINGTGKPFEFEI